MPALKNSRWEAFARFTAKGMKRGEAFLAAGFTAKKHGVPDKETAANRGSNLYARHPEIQARVEEIVNEDRELAIVNSEVTREMVLTKLVENHARASQAEPVLNRSGEPIGDYVYQGTVVNRSLELLGKELGMFADRHIFEGLDKELDGMDGNQIRQFIRGAATEVGLRMVDMNPDELRDFILQNAAKVGLKCVEITEREQREITGEKPPVH